VASSLIFFFDALPHIYTNMKLCEIPLFKRCLPSNHSWQIPNARNCWSIYAIMSARSRSFCQSNQQCFTPYSASAFMVLFEYCSLFKQVSKIWSGISMLKRFHLLRCRAAVFVQ